MKLLKMKTPPVKAILIAFGLMAHAAFAADTLVVDKVNGPYTTIQAAVDAANPGDTVFIRNGVYDTDGKMDTFATSMSNRVFITKSLTLEGESKEGVIVKGAHATVAADSAGLGLGSDAVRCIGIKANDVVIKKMTITGGATHVPTSNDNADGNGGGIYMPASYTGVQIVDCIISNNIAQRAGGARHGDDGYARNSRCLFARCWFDGNKAYNRDPVGRGILLVHCLCTRHYYTSTLFYSATTVNCTFADGNCRSHNDNANARAYNCIFADTFYKMDDAGPYRNCLFNHSYAMSTTANTNEFCVFSAGYDHFMAPVLNDYRLHDGATLAIGKGDAAYLTDADLGIPEAYRYTDFYGNAFAPQDGKVNIGCSQQAITPAGGTITFVGQSGMAAVSSVAAYGCTSDCGLYSFGETSIPLTQSKYLAYLRAETYPMTLRVRHEVTAATAASRKLGLHCFAASGADTMVRFPLMDGSFVVMAPPAGQTLTLAPKFNSAVLWVDRQSQAESPDGSEESPYASIQSAIDAIANGNFGTIYVKEGTYDNEEGKIAYGLKNRIHSNGRYVRLVSADGIGKATILGAPDPQVEVDAWPFGCGAGAMRCAYLENSWCAIQGFALTQGYSNTDADNNARRGAALYLSGSAQALDCVITNNVGYQGVAINGEESGQVPTAWAFRCLIADNYSITPTSGAQTKTGGTSGIVRSTSLGSCILRGNHGNNFGSYERQYTCQCTIVGGADNVAVVSGTGASINLLVAAPENKFNGQLLYGGVCNFKEGAFSGSSVSAVKADPLLADPASGDFRMGCVSLARTYGVTTHGDLTDAHKADYYMMGATDFYGNPMRFENGKPVCGAIQTFAPTVVASGDGIEPGGTVVVASGAVSATFTATSAATRPYLGFLVNGETQRVAQTTYEFPIPAQNDYPDAFSISAIYDTNWYVDPSGDDGNSGLVDAPKKTLKGGLAHAIAGDTVHVAAGVYATEEMHQTKQLGNSSGAFDLLSRAVVPEGVALVGAGAETTFIVGAADPDVDLEGPDRGCGPKAVRCVALGANARLSGFTLTGGRTDAEGNADNFHGGGVLASCSDKNLPQITDCVVSNCVARRGGGGMFGIYDRCRFFDNAVVRGGNGSGMRGNGGGTAVIRNSILDRCAGWATLYMVPTVENCTIGAGNSSDGTIVDGNSVIVDCPNVNNTLILGWKNADGAIAFRNCAYGPETKAYLKKSAVGTEMTFSGCIEADSLDELRVDSMTYMPVVDANIAIDGADDTLYAGGDTDCNGKARFVNGNKLDIGAVEADWLAAYSKAIGPRVRVTAADGAVERIGGKVTIPSGSTLAATVGKGGGTDRGYILTATVGTDGSCAVAQDGADLTTLVPGPNETRFAATGDSTALEFAASGLGSTVLDRIRSDIGSLLIVR